MEIEVDNKKYKIRELTYLEALEIEDARKNGVKEATKLAIKFCAGLSDEEVEKLPLKTGVKLQSHINQVNAMDFQEPTRESSEN